VYDETQGMVALLPIATGINASVSLAPETEQGKNMVVGREMGEALVSRDDFKTLFKQRAKSARAASTVSMTPWMEEALGVAHYPHVRAMVERPFRCVMENEMTITEDLLPDAEALVVKAFCGKNMTRSQLPVGLVPTKPFGDSLDEVIPVPSFFSWYHIHRKLENARRTRHALLDIPFNCVDGTWVSGAVKYPLFEHRCFLILGYFLSVFGPIQGYLRSMFLGHLTAPLREWFPQAAFVVKQSVTLGHEMEHYNPTSATAGHSEMPQSNLVEDFVEPLLRMSQSAEPGAAWFWCGGTAPIDFILIVTEPPELPGGPATLQLRFADAKHTNKDDTKDQSGVGQLILEMQEKAKLVHEAIENNIVKINKALGVVRSKTKGSKKTKGHEVNAYTAIVQRLRGKMTIPAVGVPLAVTPFNIDHLLLCHNRANTAMLSPSTFTWEPWSPLLFLSSPGPQET
jgi:hypothetical protein